MIKCPKPLPERETLAVIALDRRLWEWSKGDPLDPDVLARLYRPTDLLSWDDISARRRVILLAEAGSGKTAEMREQARLRVAAGQFAFFATVEDVANDGLEGALRLAARPHSQRGATPTRTRGSSSIPSMKRSSAAYGWTGLSVRSPTESPGESVALT